MILVPRKRLQDLNEILDTEDFPVCLLLHDRSAAAACVVAIANRSHGREKAPRRSVRARFLRGGRMRIMQG